MSSLDRTPVRVAQRIALRLRIDYAWFVLGRLQWARNRHRDPRRQLPRQGSNISQAKGLSVLVK